jgi:hypothetical protein
LFLLAKIKRNKKEKSPRSLHCFRGQIFSDQLPFREQ